MEKFKEFIIKKLMHKSSVAEDLLVGIVVILAGYFYYYENKQIISNIQNPEKINYIIKIIVGVIIIITWLYLSFQNGIKKRRSFLISTLILWLIPQIIKYCVDIFDKGEYSSTLQRSFAIFAKYLSGINYLSLKTIGDAIYNGVGVPYYFTLNFIIILFEIMFIIGFSNAGYFKNNKISEVK